MKFLSDFGQKSAANEYKKNAIIVNSRICFQQAIYALNLIDISFYGERKKQSSSAVKMKLNFKRESKLFFFLVREKEFK